MSAKKKIRFLTSPKELKLTVRAAAVLLASPVLLKRYDIQKTVGLLTPRRAVKSKKRVSQDRVIDLCHRVLSGFSKVSYKTNCLRRCLLYYHCLRRQGEPVEIIFGVKMGKDDLQGHCWLTSGERLIGDREEMVKQFTPMFSLPSLEAADDSDSELWTTIERLNKLSFDD
jgi:hypothetical protein